MNETSECKCPDAKRAAGHIATLWSRATQNVSTYPIHFRLAGVTIYRDFLRWIVEVDFWQDADSLIYPTLHDFLLDMAESSHNRKIFWIASYGNSLGLIAKWEKELLKTHKTIDMFNLGDDHRALIAANTKLLDATGQ